jgi:hypothetical protein
MFEYFCLIIFFSKLENYLIRSGYDLILDLSKCFKLNETTNQLEQVEPLDILIHALHLCEDKFTKMELQNKFQDQLDEDIKKHSDCIRAYFEQLKQNLGQGNPQYVLDIYTSQIKSKLLSNVKSNNTALPPSTALNTQKQTQSVFNTNVSSFDFTTFMPFYQCILGSMESLMEHFYSTGNYKSVRDLYKRFNLLYDLVQKKFSGSTTTNEPKKKTPAPAKKKQSAKKSKNGADKNEDEEDVGETTTVRNNLDDDDEIRASANDYTRVGDLSNMEQPVLESTKTGASAKKKGGSSTAAKKQNATKFEYVHRISYTCLYDLIDDYFGFVLFLSSSFFNLA